MRVLMTTGDHLMIDRRILQEASSLHKRGYSTTLLAGFECNKAEDYSIGATKIVRSVYDWGDSRFGRVANRFKLTPGSQNHTKAWKIFKYWSENIANLNSFENFVLDRMLEHDADIVHAHDLPMLPSAVRYANIKSVPLIYDAHEIYYSQVQFPKEVQDKYRNMEKRLIGRASATITVNPFLADLMKQRYRARRPHVIYNASPLQAITYSNRLRSTLGLTQDARIVLYQGWISDNRGIERLVEAAKYFDPDIYFVVIGYGAFTDALKSLAEQKKVSDKVKFYGGVSSDDLHELTCDADLGVIPYYGVDDNNLYCSPNKLFEFAVAELPFIANDLPFLKSIVEQFGCGLLSDLSSPESIAHTVNRLFSNPSQISKLKQGAREAREHLNWSVEERKLLAIYEDLLSNNRN